MAEYKGAHKSDQYHTSVRFAKDQSYIVQASEDGKLVIYDIVSKQVLATLRGHVRPVITVDRHPVEHGRYASGSADGTIKVWACSG